MSNETKSKNVTVTNSSRKANIAVAVVVSVAALILIAIAVMSFVNVDPMSDIKRPEHYEFYDVNSSDMLGASERPSQSKIYSALDGMGFSVMSGILQNKWDYSYNFIRNKSDKKVKVAASDISGLRSKEKGFMIEFVYKQIHVVNDKLDMKVAQKLEVDGEVVYYDRIKMFITDSNGEIGTVRLYPYIYARVDNSATGNDELSSAKYSITGITVRANTTNAYRALEKLASSLKK